MPTQRYLDRLSGASELMSVLLAFAPRGKFHKSLELVDCLLEALYCWEQRNRPYNRGERSATVNLLYNMLSTSEGKSYLQLIQDFDRLFPGQEYRQARDLVCDLVFSFNLTRDRLQEELRLKLQGEQRNATITGTTE